MSQLINILVTNRGPLLEALKTPTSYGFDVEDIVSPITVNAVTGKSVFVARTNKGGLHDDKNGSKINYETAETLLAIAAKSPLLVLLNVVSRRGVDKNSEAYVFVTSKITESLTPISSGVGTRFYYIEDGDNLPVEYVVSQTVAQIVAQSSAGAFIVQDSGVDMPQEQKLNFVGYTVEDNPGNSSTDIIAVKPIEYAGLEILRAAGNLPLGAQYLITDRGDAGIIVDVSAPNKISLRAKGLFLVPDFQNVGTYTTTPLPKATNRGVWSLSEQTGAPFANGDIVFWDGIMYQVTDDTLFDTNPPSLNASAYAVLTKNVNNGYILDVDAIKYDFDGDVIIERADKRGNIIRLNDAITYFQWGNDNVTDCRGYFACINNRGILRSLTFPQTANISEVSDLNLGTVSNCSFEIGNINLSIRLGSSGNMSDSIIKTTVFEPGTSIVIESNVAFQGEMDSFKSSFAKELDMSDVAIFSAGVLTIPINDNYIGEFTLINNSGQTITKIVNLPTIHKVTRFYVQAGNTQSFQHVAVSGAIADTLNADAIATNAIIGRTNSSDYIEYERSGIKNVRTNIVKLS